MQHFENLPTHQEILNELGKRTLLDFTKQTFSKFSSTPFHDQYYSILNDFAHGRIKNLIISAPPQHGKSEGSSRRLPAYMAGIRPDIKMALVSYAATKAQKFGREVINIVREESYTQIFPDVHYPERGYIGAKANTNENRESVNSDGSMKFVGVDGSLTGDQVDVLILDDLYKNWQEANSPVKSEHVWDFYNTVAETRLHNDSQQLIVFTRWSGSDLVGRLEKLGRVIDYDDVEDLNDVPHDHWVKVNFEAIKTGEPGKIDTRKADEALWPNRHSLERLVSIRAKDPVQFSCLHQGKPQSKEGLLYSKFNTYDKIPELKAVKNYTDTADTGTDYLCSICYGEGMDGKAYILDIVYTQEPMEVTEVSVPLMLERNKVNVAMVESNNGGRGFARRVDENTNQSISVNWFNQSKNKESRIYSESANVTNNIVMPSDWHIRFSDFHDHVTNYKKVFKANRFDDAPDCLTGIAENLHRADFFIG